MISISSVNELYHALERMMKENPETKNLYISACGAQAVLFAYRDDPNGIITGVALEDSDYLDQYKSDAENHLNDANNPILSEQHMYFLIQLCANGTSLDDIQNYIHECVANYSAQPNSDQTDAGFENKKFRFRSERTITLTSSDIDRMIFTALNGGITSRWVSIATPATECLGEFVHEQISKGGVLKLYEHNENAIHELSLSTFIEGFTVWYEGENDSAHIINAEGRLELSKVNAETVDHIIQYALLGAILYD